DLSVDVLSKLEKSGTQTPIQDTAAGCQFINIAFSEDLLNKGWASTKVEIEVGVHSDDSI
ncbi:15295_t:CDS:1, partial [Gigaspora margarita]